MKNTHPHPQRGESNKPLGRAAGLNSKTMTFIAALLAAVSAGRAPAETLPLVDIRAAGMTPGLVTAATNTGTLGGSFTPSGNGPSVDIVHGKLAMQFTGSGWLTLTGGSPVPATIIGAPGGPAPVYTHIAWLYRPDLEGGSQVFLQWAPYDHGALWQYGNPGERYADHWAAGWDIWWNPGSGSVCPAAGSWHAFVTTCDGVTESLYIDPPSTGTPTPVLSVALGGDQNFANAGANYPIHLGAMDWWGVDDSYDRIYTGAIGSVQIWPFAIAAADVAAAAAAIVPVEPANAHTIHASADANSSITPSGDVIVLDGGAQTFAMAANMEYNISDVLVDFVSKGVTNSWPFSGVTGDHTISVSSILATTHIMGVVSGLPAGETAQVTAKGATGSATVTTGTDGSYAILAGNGTYAVTARGSGLLSVGPLPVTIADADATLNLALTNSPLVDFRADVLPSGSVSSAANPGTLGGNFVPTGTSPSVGTVGGKKAVVFDGTPMTLKDSGGAPIAPPAAILGANGGATPKYTVSGWLYRDNIDNWNCGWLSWSVGDHCNWFQYGTGGWGWCFDAWGSGYGSMGYPGGVPAAGAWYHFCVTCDGATTNLWITYPDDSVHSASSGGSGYLYPDSSFFIGEIAPSHEGGRPFIGGIASVEVWPVAVTVADLPAIRAFAPPVTISAGPYGDWQAANFSGAQIAAGLADPGADPDGDAMTNFQEFAFGLNPNSGASVNPVTVPLDKTTGKFRYTRGATTGLTYSVWTSTNLAIWDGPAAVTEEVVVPPDANQVETVEVTLTDFSPPPGGKLFVRVKAQ